MPAFEPYKHPVTIKSLSSNTISDRFRDSLEISYSFIGNSVPDSSFEFAGRTLSAPIMMGPIHGYSRDHAEEAAAELAVAKAVAEAGSVYWSHFHDKAGWADILAAGVPAIRVIKPLASNERLLEEIAFDTEHGAIGYAMDIDYGMNQYGVPDRQQEPFASKTAADLKLLNEASPLPFFLKSILSVSDAVQAAEIGAAGIILSGHNNRFPCAVPPLKLIPAVREAVGDQLMILVDGGLDTGYEVFKALALGADGVLSARALLGAYVKEQAGPDGVLYKLQEMGAELRGAMANTGSPDLKHINKNALITR